MRHFIFVFLAFLIYILLGCSSRTHETPSHLVPENSNDSITELFSIKDVASYLFCFDDTSKNLYCMVDKKEILKFGLANGSNTRKKFDYFISHFSYGNGFLIVCSTDGDVQFIEDNDDFKVAKSIKLPSAVTNSQFSLDGKKIVFTTFDENAVVIKLDDFSIQGGISRYARCLQNPVLIVPESESILALSDKFIVTEHFGPGYKEATNIFEHNAIPEVFLYVSQLGTCILSVSHWEMIVWDYKKRIVIDKIPHTRFGIILSGVIFCGPLNCLLLYGGRLNCEPGYVLLLDGKNFQEKARWRINSGPIMRMQISPNDQFLASIGLNHELRIWRFKK